MSGLRLPNLIEIPPGGWRYFVAETGQWITSYADFNDFKRELIKHMRANNVPVPLEMDGLIQDQLCANLPPGKCGRPDLQLDVKAPAPVEAIMRGTATIGEWLLSGESVGTEEVARRAKICSGCPYNRDTPGCTSCVAGKIAGFIVGFIKDLPRFPYLKSCAVCGCFLNVKIHVPKAEIQKREPAGVTNQYPDFCWMKE